MAAVIGTMTMAVMASRSTGGIEQQMMAIKQYLASLPRLNTQPTDQAFMVARIEGQFTSKWSNCGGVICSPFQGAGIVVATIPTDDGVIAAVAWAGPKDSAADIELDEFGAVGHWTPS